MKTILIDDEPLARVLVREYLDSHKDIEIIGEYQDGFQGAKWIDEQKPDLVFLDVQMPKISGFEMLELIDHQPKIIFTTAFDEFALKAFENNAIDYLLKPFSKERFDKAVNKARNEIEDKKSLDELRRSLDAQSSFQLTQILVKDHGNALILQLDDIIYIESFDDYVKLHSHDKTYIKKSTLNYFDQQLAQQGFTRIHRSFLVNRKYVLSIHTDENRNHFAQLSNGESLPISRSGYSDLKILLIK